MRKEPIWGAYEFEKLFEETIWGAYEFENCFEENVFICSNALHRGL